MEPVDIVVQEVPANRRRQRGSGFGRFLMQLVFFLASLIPMCIIAWKLDVAGLMRPQPMQVAQRLDTKPERDRNPPEKSLPPQPRKSRIPQDWFQPPLPEDQQPRKEKPTSRFITPPEEETEDESLEPLPRALKPIGPNQTPNNESNAHDMTHDDLPRPCAIVTLDLTNRVIRVIAETQNTPANSLAVDIALSEELTNVPVQRAPQPPLPGLVKKPLSSMHHTMVAKDLRKGSHSILFNSGIQSTQIGIFVTIEFKDNKAIVKLEPKLTLPSGHEEPHTRKDGLSSLRQLNKALDDAAAAQDAVPGLQAELASANRDYQTARNTAAFQRQLGRLWIGEAGIPAIARHIEVLERQLGRAQALSTQLAAIQDDWRAINEVATYGDAIAGLGTVYVHIHNDDESFAADVR